MKNEEFRMKNERGAGLRLRESLRAHRVNASSIVNFLRLLAATLREIFDEAPYARFLQRHGLTSSRASYAAFQREIAVRRERRARCC